MAIMALFRSAHVDPALYDQIMQEIGGLEVPPAGALMHVSGFDGEGLHVVEVWESRAQFDAFLRDRIQPVLEKLDVAIAPPVVIEAHAVHTTHGVDAYKLAAAAG
jgi:hypothetical protein